MKPLKERFSQLVKNNSGKDWNSPVFRHTMADAFRFCANQDIEWWKKDRNEILRKYRSLQERFDKLIRLNKKESIKQ